MCHKTKELWKQTQRVMKTGVDGHSRTIVKCDLIALIKIIIDKDILSWRSTCSIMSE